MAGNRSLAWAWFRLFAHIVFWFTKDIGCDFPMLSKPDEYDTAEDLKGFTWDWCMVFQIGDSEKQINVSRKRGASLEIDEYTYFRRVSVFEVALNSVFRIVHYLFKCLMLP